ncbi:MAG: hypothetical protein KDC12_14370 [Flavobacteriales bacterium]|nr:hypothetical protein [Flavobacteriales bacterium]
MTDEAFEVQFANCTFPPELFDHKAHIRLAWIHLKNYGLNQAIENLCTQIQIYDRTHDEGIRYHATLTAAAVRIVHQCMRSIPTASFEQLLNHYPELMTNLKGLISRQYSNELLGSERAKQEVLNPDLG